MSMCVSKGIQFHFVQPTTTHFGGLWEAKTKSAKHLLIGSDGKMSQTYEEFETVIIEIEAILNFRPLSPMSNYQSDMSALISGHSLTGGHCTQFNEMATSAKVGTRVSVKARVLQAIFHRIFT